MKLNFYYKYKTILTCLYLGVIVMLLPTLSFTQNYTSDSLKLELEKEHPDSTKALILLTLIKRQPTNKDSSTQLLFIEQLLALSENLEDQHYYAQGLFYKAEYLNSTEANKKEVLLAYDKALKAFEQLNSWEGCLQVLESLGSTFLSQKKYKKALEQYLIVEKTLEDEGNWKLMQAKNEYRFNLIHKTYLGMTKSYEALGNYDEALIYHKKYRATHDSIMKLEKQNLVQKNEIKYRVIQKEAENKLLKAEHITLENRIKKRNTILTAIIAIALLSFFLASIFLRNSQRRKNYALVLEDEVKKRTDTLNESNEKLKKINLELQAFAYITSHDLKEPLRNISGFASLLERDINNKAYGNLPDLLGFIKKNVHQMFTLIEDIMEFTTVGKNIGDNDLVDFEDIQDFVNNELEPLITENNAHVYFEFDEHMKGQKLIPAQIKTALKNLVENGIKYNEKKSPTVWVNYKDSGDGSHNFSVLDNGIGISSEYTDQIFKMFKRLHTRETYEGSGIGLAICRKVVENLSGKVYLEHSDEHGSHFMIVIPKNRSKGDD